MARPRTLSDEAVLAAAGRVLRREGPSFTLAQVAAAAGLSPATLVQRFGSRRGLLLAFVRREAERAADPFRDAARREGSPLRALRRVLRAQARSLGGRRAMAASLALLLEDVRDPGLRAAAGAHARGVEAAVRDLLRRAVGAGELRGDPRALALSVQCAWNGAVLQWALRGTGSAGDFVDRALAPLLRAARAPQKTAPTSS